MMLAIDLRLSIIWVIENDRGIVVLTITDVLINCGTTGLLGGWAAGPWVE